MDVERSKIAQVTQCFAVVAPGTVGVEPDLYPVGTKPTSQPLYHAQFGSEIAGAYLEFDAVES